MKFTRITDRQAREALAVAVDLDVSASQMEEDRMDEVERIDALIESVERELAAEEHLESVRVTRNMADPVFARRSRRRSGRVALRRLPARSLSSVLAEFDSEAA